MSNHDVSGRSRASFIIQGNGLDLDAISNNIAIKPTHVHRAGDSVFTHRTDKHYEQDMWKLTSALPNEEIPDNHIKWLSQQLSPFFDYIKSLEAVAEIYIYCGFTTKEEQSQFFLSPEALSIFVDLNIPVYVSIHAI